MAGELPPPGWMGGEQARAQWHESRWRIHLKLKKTSERSSVMSHWMMVWLLVLITMKGRGTRGSSESVVDASMPPSRSALRLIRRLKATRCESRQTMRVGKVIA